MKKLLAILSLFATTNIYCQNIELSGKVDYPNMKEKGKIYYSTDGGKFDSKHFVLYDKKGYKFKMSISKIKKENINFLFFSPDTTQDVNGEYACVQKINVGKILHSEEFKNLKTIKLNTDLPLEQNCGLQMYSDAKMRNKDRFVGRYQLLLNDTIHHIELNDALFEYKSQLSKMTTNYMTEEEGRWNHNDDTKTLKLFIRYQTNKDFGLILLKNLQLEFKVTETPDGMTFESEQGVLRKM